MNPSPPSIRRLAACATSLALALAFTHPSLAADAGYLVPNGSFEIDSDGNQWPDGWGRPKAGGSWEQEEGNHFIRMTSSAPGETVMLYQQIQIPETVKAIELKWRMRVTNLKKGKQTWFDARIMMDFKDVDGKKLKGAPAPNTGKSTEGWVRFSASNPSRACSESPRHPRRSLAKMATV